MYVYARLQFPNWNNRVKWDPTGTTTINPVTKQKTFSILQFYSHLQTANCKPQTSKNAIPLLQQKCTSLINPNLSPNQPSISTPPTSLKLPITTATWSSNFHLSPTTTSPKAEPPPPAAGMTPPSTTIQPTHHLLVRPRSGPRHGSKKKPGSSYPSAKK